MQVGNVRHRLQGDTPSPGSMARDIRSRIWRLGRDAGGLVLLGAAAFFAMGPAAVLGGDPVTAQSGGTLDGGDLETRADHGFSTDLDYVLGFVAAGEDVGTAEWGFPMTREEVAEVERRSAFVQAAHDSGLIDRARARPDFAGAYVDHQQDGKLVILVTSDAEEASSSLLALVPAGGPGMEVRRADYTFAQLEDAKDSLMREPDGARFSLNYKVHEASVDEENNRLVVTIADEASSSVAAARDQLAALLGVRVHVVTGAASSEQQECTSRENCHDPMEAGNVIRKGSATGPRCTMAFHIVINSDEQFVTAGHCGFSGSNTWYHAGFGSIGVELATIYVQNGVDIMRVQMSDSQDSNQIYGETRPVTSSRNPMQNETVCASRGVSNGIDCGTVSDTSTSWIGEACGCTINGADHNGISTTDGDSGSPIYVRASATSAVAVGVHNTASGGFARLQSALNVWGATIRN